jgi:DNA replication and repair protein RecF
LMFLSGLELRNFRNYPLLQLKLLPGVNIFLGENAQGKTNILEAVVLLCIGKSFRTRKESDFIRWENEAAYLKGNFEADDGTFQVEIGFGAQTKKIKINGQDVKGFDCFAKVPVVVFSPEDLQLIKGGPQYRRDFIDLYLAQIDPKYRHVYLNYYKILQQRNRFLKASFYSPTEWEVWNEQLIDKGTQVILYRAFLLEKIQSYIATAHSRISVEREFLKLDYCCLGKYLNPERNETGIRALLEREIQRVKGAEMERKISLAGPQRDDFVLSINQGIDLKTFGSQGQQRTAALALKLGMVEVIRETREKPPLLLLDDVMSEFDDTRKLSLLKILINSTQTLITATSRRDFPDLPAGAAFFGVQRGAVSDVD